MGNMIIGYAKNTVVGVANIVAAAGHSYWEKSGSFCKLFRKVRSCLRKKLLVNTYSRSLSHHVLQG